MIDFSTLNDQFLENIKHIEETADFLEDLYKDPKIATPFNKPVISVLITACDYLSTNLDILNRKIIKS